MGKENVPPPKNGKRSSQIPTKTLTTESSEALENNESSEDTDTTETIAEPKKKLGRRLGSVGAKKRHALGLESPAKKQKRQYNKKK
jgi:hypothetical protein